VTFCEKSVSVAFRFKPAELIVYRRPQRRIFEQEIAEIIKGFTVRSRQGIMIVKVPFETSVTFCEKSVSVAFRFKPAELIIY
jgi:hypothetical protein